MNPLDRRQRLAVRAAWIIVATGSVVFLLSIVLAQGNGSQLHPLGVRLIAPAAFLVDSPGALSIVATDHARRAPAAGVSVVVRLASKDGTQGAELLRGKTNRQGTLDARFRVPNLQPGAYELHVDASAGAFTEHLVQPVELRREWSILLVTDKPLYQPSQVIHMRALVTRRPDVKPVAQTEVTFEVRDPKGNKMFKKVVTTNEFGAAWADFQLADEINLGEYQCKAIAGDAEAQKAVTVKRYMLPKFKVSVSTDRDFYLPATKLSGSVTAAYFFGKPVAGGKVVVTAKTFDVEYTKIAQVEGKTNAEGAFTFSIDLPRHFVGQPFEQGKAFVELEVAVTDTADHTEKVTLSRPVVAQELQIHAVPESGQLVPNVPNNVWILVSEPSGKPVQAKVRLENVTADEPWSVEWRRQTVDTDELGIAQVTVTPKLSAEAARTLGMDEEQLGGLDIEEPLPPGRRFIVAPNVGAPEEGMPPTGPIHLSLAARSPSGQVSKTTVNLPTSMATDNESMLLRVDKALAKVGDTLRVTALASVATGYVYFDVIKDRQTMLTAAGDLRSGRAETEIALGPELAGTVYVSAYRITRRGNIVRDVRPVIVDPASDLRIGVRASRDVYRPGEPARVEFEVKTRAGQPAQAAIGVSVVDESVFALQEMQPGLERVYAYLEEQLRKPRYEIHGLELPVIIAKPLPAVDERAQRAAQVMLAAADIGELELNTQDSYLQRLQAAKAQWVKKMLPKLVVVRRAIQQYIARHDEPPTVEEGAKPLLEEKYLKREDLKDLWGHEMKLVPTWPGMDRLYDVALLSAGPDGTFDTEDDVLVIEPEMEGRPRPRLFEVLKARGMPEAMAEGEAMPAAAPPGPGGGFGGGAPEAKPVRVREYFPETLLFRPDLITDEAGRATVEFKMADSITTWRMTAIANSAAGELGSTDAPLRCFQDFFVDLDLPVALTQGDEISLPVAVYNYLKDRQTVRLKLETQPWFSLSGEAEQTLDLSPNEVTVRHFRIKAEKLGEHTLTVFAYGTKMSDAIRRSVRVEPDGKPFEEARNGRLTGETDVVMEIPAKAIEGASNILVKVYPGVFSQVLEGLEGLLQMPFGCFEQTSSVTYPNILVLDYMKTTRQATPEIQMKAEGLINYGYQRLVSYEVPGGGFSWFGDPPANKLLTAMGVMEFYDMMQVFPIDENVITRTQAWLLSQQNADGSWDADKSYLHEEAWGRLQNAKLLPTAYITWALASTGEKSAGTRNGYNFVRAHWKEGQDPYQLAVVCNALVAGDNLFHGGELDDVTIEACDALVAMAKREGEKMWWESEMTGFTHSRGTSADLEATGLAAIALIASGRYAAEATQVLNYLTEAKDSGGTWGSTQATVLALKALLMAQKGAASKASGTVEVVVNDKPVTTFEITPDTADVMRVADCRQFVREGTNKVRISFKGQGSMLYQVAAKYYLPWSLVPKAPGELLDISVRYDKTKLAVNDTVTATVTVKNKAPGRTSMIVVDLGIPPGFAVEAGDLAELVDAKTINKFNLTGRQIIVYLEQLTAGQEVTFSYRLRALFPVTAKAPASQVYEYYDPDNRAEATSRELVVTD